MASYLIQETGGKLLLENGAGSLLLEISVPAGASVPVDDGSWYIHAQQAQGQPRRRKPEPLLPVFVLPNGDWTDEELAFLLAADVFG